MDTRQTQSYNFKEISENSNLMMVQKSQQATHHLKLVDKMWKYEMDPASIVNNTEQTQFCPQTNRWTDGRTYKVKPV